MTHVLSKGTVAKSLELGVDIEMLSELSKTYLEHFDAICDGRRALEADVSRVLGAVHEELVRTDGDMAPEMEAGKLSLIAIDGDLQERERGWYGLALTWTVDEGGPVLTLTPSYDELDKDLFSDLFTQVHLPEIQRALLAENSVQACLSAWREARAKLDAITDADGGEFQARWAAQQLLEQVSRELVPRVTQLLDTTQQTEVGETSSDELAPCYVGWEQEAAGKDDSSWCVTLDTVHPKGKGLTLGLVVWDGADVVERAGIDVLTTDRHGHPVVADFSQQLADVVAKKRTRTEVASEIAEACLKLYSDTLAKLVEQARKARK